MKHRLVVAGIVLLGVASVVVGERRKVDVSTSAAGLLYLVADTEQELMRMPVSFARMSDQEEIRIGNELARSYAMEQGRENNQEAVFVEQYLTEVGSKVAAGAHRKLPYSFHYVPNSYFINAFALPGGHVYLGGGLLSLMDSEDELAAVTGHEIEHIDHYHCGDRVQQEQALRKIPLGGLVAVPIEIFEAGYSKDQELEADREGTRLAVKAGYSAAGAIRMFETFDRLYKEYETRAKTPQEEVSQVALQTLEGYFRSHPLPSERIFQVQRMIANEGWVARPERDLAVAYLFWTAKAQDQLNAHRYARAEQLANQSLRLRPDQSKALQVLARAQFAQANFSGAATSYRKVLEAGVSDRDVVPSYAQALAAADRQRAISEFRRWAGSVEGKMPPEAAVAEAGLALLAGDLGPAHKLEIELKQNHSVQAPLLLGESGWWNYLAGDYQNAVNLLSQAAQQRPGDIRTWLRLAWAQIEVQHYRDTLQALSEFAFNQQMQPERGILRAVALWQAQEHDAALRDFNVAVTEQPEWGNRAWVKALYSPLVLQSIAEMQGESERRKQKAKVAASR